MTAIVGVAPTAVKDELAPTAYPGQVCHDPRAGSVA